ncbi:MAG TPA: tetratricopeptide repeat protein [Terriglobales bacterium]|nr:tetratricopeptide repeat protein [Terriglobales bacterium]
MRTRPFSILIVAVVSLAALALAQTAPLTKADIDKLLDGGVSPTRVAILVEQQGIDFDPDPNYLRDLDLRANADKLSDALRTAGLQRTLKRGDADLKAGRWAQAELDYRATLALQPSNTQAHAGLGTALVQQGRGESAIPELGLVLAAEPNNAAAHRGMGMALMQRKDYAGAVTELGKARQLEPNDAMTHAALADAMLEQGDADSAVGEYSQALKLDVNLMPARLGLGRAFERKGDLAGAENNYRYLLALDSRNARANYGLASVMEKKGNTQDALNFYRNAYTADPGNEQYRTSYERMVALAAAAAVNANQAPPQPTGFGLIHIYRPSRFVGGAGTWNVSVDDRLTAKLGNGRHFTVRVPAGHHTLFSELAKQPVGIEVAPNGEYYVVSELVSQLFSAYTQFTVMPDIEGRKQFDNTRPIEPNRIYDRERIVEAGGDASVGPVKKR